MNSFRRLLIDTTDPGKRDYLNILEGVLNEENATISTIIATHWHHDHVGSIEDVKLKKLVSDDCKIWKFPRSDATEDYGSLKFLDLVDRQEFDLNDGTKIKIYHTPGHTTDHIILFNETTKELFSGDCILGEGTAVFEDLFDYMKSLEIIMQLQPAIIYPGHADVIADKPIEKIQYYINHRNERERQILETIFNSKEPLTGLAIVKIVYTTTPSYLYSAALKNVDQHLIKLKKEGKVVEVEKNNEVSWKASSQGNKL